MFRNAKEHSAGPAANPSAAGSSSAKSSGSASNGRPGVLERLPQVSGRRDVCRVLGYEPKRSSLSKALFELSAGGVLAREESGGGKVPSRCRRL